MRNLARKLERTSEVGRGAGAHQDTGTVVRAAGRTVSVRVGGEELSAKRAVSCLIEPEAGDRVLVAFADNEVYVLAVLEREEGAPATLSHDGDLGVKLQGGRFTVAAQEGVTVASGKDVSVVSGSVSVKAVEGEVALESLSLLGAVVRADLAKLKVLAGTVDSVFDRISQRVKRSFRFVEETEQLRAERIDYVAKKSMNMRGENTLITAEELVKIDGEQVHLG